MKFIARWKFYQQIYKKQVLLLKTKTNGEDFYIMDTINEYEDIDKYERSNTNYSANISKISRSDICRKRAKIQMKKIPATTSCCNMTNRSKLILSCAALLLTVVLGTCLLVTLIKSNYQENIDKDNSTNLTNPEPTSNMTKGR